MSPLHVLHVDDEPDIRAIVEMSLQRDPDVTVQGCASGADALKVAREGAPDLILLDVMMPGMDGPTMLGHLRESPITANIPVVFMTARAQTREIEHFRSLGAAGVISKPFDPMTLAVAVRRYSQDARLAPLRASFVRRAGKDAAALEGCSQGLAARGTSPAILADIRALAHGLAGAGGIYGFVEISEAAAALEHDVIAEQSGEGRPEKVGQALDALLVALTSIGDANGKCTSSQVY
jgi:two-component system OmpR family response regulator